MNSKPILFVLFSFLFLSSFSFAQQTNIDIAWGPENQVPKKTYFSDIIGTDQNHYYLIKNYYKGKSVQWLVKYNMRHEVEAETLIKMTLNNEDAVNEGIYLLKDHFVIFLSKRDKVKDKNVLYAVITGKDGKQEAPVEVDAIDYKSRWNMGNFRIYPSKDLTKILVYHDEAYEKKGYERFNCKMYSQNMELLWEKPVELPYKDSKLSVSTCRIDEEGNVFVLGTLSVEKNIDQFKMFAYYFKKDRLEEVDVDFAKAYSVTSLQFDYMDGHLLFIGFYADAKRSGIKGMVYNKIHAKSLNKVAESAQPFNREDLIKFSSEKAVDKGNGLPPNYKIDHILVNAQGDLTIVAEYYYVSVSTYTTKTGTYTTYTYHYNQIMVINLDAKGEIHRVSNIDKYQSSTNDGGKYSSYVFAYANNELYFLYNDRCQTATPPEEREKITDKRAARQAARSSCVILAKVNEKGEVSKSVFETVSKEATTYFIPRKHIALSGDRVLVCATGGKTYKYGTLSVK